MNRKYLYENLSMYRWILLVAVLLPCLASYATHTVLSDASPRTVEIPDFDPGNASHRLIESTQDWSSINDPSLTHFFVVPGDYSDLDRISIRSSGTRTQPRTVSYYDPANPDENRPPVQLPASRRALVGQIEFSNASYWVVQRLAVRSTEPPIWFHDGSDSDHNVFDQLMVEGGIKIWDKADYNSFQSSFFTHNRPRPGLDANCVSITSNASTTTPGPIGNQFVDSEFRDCAGDGIQFVHRPENLAAGSFAEGTRISNNDFYLTNALYSDCNGNLSRDGDCACAENGVDIKSSTAAEGDVPSERWIQVTKNRFWGYRRTDTACGGTGSDGSAVTIHNPNADYILFRDNQVWDSTGGVETSKFASDRTDHVSLINNVFYDIDGYAYDGRRGSQYEAFFNTFIDTKIYLKLGHYNYDTGFEHDFMCNVMIRAGQHNGDRIDVFRSAANAYYDTVDYTGPNDDDLNFADPAASENVPLCMRIARWSEPREFCIPWGRATVNSPHWRLCPAVTGTANRGVDDKPVQNPWRDSRPVLQISAPRAQESSQTAIVKVQLNPPSSQSVKVSLASVSTGSALPGEDYYGVYRVLTFASGETEKSINLPLIDDDQSESDERFDVRIFNPLGARVATSRATIVIEDDDVLARDGFSMTAVEVIEGQSALFAVNRRGDLSVAASVHVATRSVSGGASPGVDFYGLYRVLQFPAGVSSRQLSVITIDDNAPEATEVVMLRLFNAEGDVIRTPQVPLRIVDDD